MQTLRYFLFGFITLTIISNAQTVIPPGDVSGNWAIGGSPYEIQGEITIPDGLTLTIEPGVLVEFQGHYKLNVEGRLLAVGAETDTITFTINDTTGFHDLNIPDGGWHGIKFDNTSAVNDSSKIIYCELEYGKAVGTGWPEKSGGAIYIDSFDKLVISNCLITNNKAGDSGGGISASKSNLRIDNCSFTENKAISTIGRGGAISCDANTTYTGFPFQVKITNCNFIENAATSRGGVFINNWAPTPLIIDVTIDNCEFLDNASDHFSGLHIFDCSFSVSNSVFAGNTAVTFTAGAQFALGIGTVTNCLFASNVASTGGGEWNSGGVAVWNGADVHFMNCTFADNTAFYGAGLTVGGGGNATITNCIFWGNSADQIALDTYNNLGGTITVNYCDIQGGEASVYVADSLSTLNWGDGNADDDPLFVNSGNGDYQLQENSSCISAATDSIEITGVWYYCPPYDIEGNPRPNPIGTIPDMGAYESEFAVGVEDNETGHPIEYALSQNYPNPFNPTTTIKYSIPELSFISIKVYDVLGSEIMTLLSEEKPIGSYEIEFNATALPSGIYFYKIQAGNFVETKKMVLMK